MCIQPNGKSSQTRFDKIICHMVRCWGLSWNTQKRITTFRNLASFTICSSGGYYIWMHTLHADLLFLGLLLCLQLPGHSHLYSSSSSFNLPFFVIMLSNKNIYYVFSTDFPFPLNIGRRDYTRKIYLSKLKE